MKWFAISLFALSTNVEAAWVLYKGTNKVQPVVNYETLAQCNTAGLKKPGNPKLYSCVQITVVIVTPPVVTPPVPVPPPPVVDHSVPGPVIDPKLVPATSTVAAGPRVRSVWRHIDTGADCAPGSEKCDVAPGLVANASDIGAFREPCGFATMKPDDPIVFPGEPGKAHMHTFFGNTGINAATNDVTIRTGASTCHGGSLNQSGYWIPTMVDTGNGKPLTGDMLVYYKGSYFFDVVPTLVDLPTGLRIVSGNAKNTNPNTVGAKYICYSPSGDNPGWANTIPDAVAKGTCKTNGTFQMDVPFPMCWDGVNLDSPNHNSHMSNPEQLQVAPFTWRCPATHPKALPSISLVVNVPITDDALVGRIRLSSDLDPKLPAGISGHGDYMMGWDPATVKAWTDNCLRKKRDCHASLLGDERTLY